MRTRVGDLCFRWIQQPAEMMVINLLKQTSKLEEGECDLCLQYCLMFSRYPAAKTEAQQSVCVYLKGFQSCLNDRSKDRLSLPRVGKHLWDLVQQTEKHKQHNIMNAATCLIIAPNTNGRFGVTHLSMTCRLSFTFTRKPSSRGTNMSDTSDTTSICGWARVDFTL